jgi:uncharacterized protein YdeI (YjbR/CyaY-like superfamily)
MNPKVDQFINREQKWQEEFEKLRMIILDCHLTEELKWGVPCYTYQNSNVVLIHGFKEYCAILFVKGSLLQDTEKILIQQTENVQAGRQVRFTNLKQIEQLASTLKAYIYEGIEIEKAGLKVEFIKREEVLAPEEFLKVLNENPALKAAFEALTPGRQKAYNMYFAEPKQSKTREARIEKSIEKILNGKGLTDR